MALQLYENVLKELGSGRAFVLLGNGFSIGCDPVFSYGQLYDAACAAGLSERAQKVFERLGSNNFEGVLRLLDDTKWVGSLYGLSQQSIAEVQKDHEIAKAALVSAVAKSHLDHTGLFRAILSGKH